MSCNEKDVFVTNEEKKLMAKILYKMSNDPCNPNSRYIESHSKEKCCFIQWISGYLTDSEYIPTTVDEAKDIVGKMLFLKLIKVVDHPKNLSYYDLVDSVI